MSLFFDNLLKKRNLTSAPVPLWRLEITDAEYAELKHILSEKCQTGEFWNYSKEIALFYAECWRREYNGGAPSKELMAKKLGLPEKQADVMFSYAKNALNSLHIPVIRQVNNQYFRTLLLQGGLPMAYVQQKEGFNKFKEFLKSLLKKVPRLELDWDNTDLVKELPCVRLLPPSYQNDNVYAVSLQIIRAIEEGRDDLLPYKSEDVELGSLTRVLKTERDNIRKQVITHPLTIDWILNIEESDTGKVGVFSYSLDNIKTIYSTMVNGLNAEDCFQFDVFVAQQFVATYKKVKYDEEQKVATYKRVNSDNKNFKWLGESVVDVKIVCDTDDEFFPSIVGACGPNLTAPQVYQKNGNGYAQQKDVKSPECIAVLPNDWNTIENDVVGNISILGETFSLVVFPEVNVAASISIVNVESGEKRELINQTSKYTVMYGGVYLPWLEKSNYALLEKRPYISVYDIDGEKWDPKAVKVRQRGETEWMTYTQHTLLRPGVVELKVVFPDGSDDVRKFYYIGTLSFHVENPSANDAFIRCDSNWGHVYPVKEECSTYDIVKNTFTSTTWKVSRTPNTSKYPTTCSFEIKNQGNPDLRISIPAPYEGLCLVRNDEVVSSGSIISVSDFSNYSVICSGTKHNTMEIGYTSTQRFAGTKVIKINVKDGITPLSNFEDAINRVFSANGFRTFDRVSAATIKFGSTNYKIRYFTLDTKANGFENSIEIRALDKESSFVGVAGKLFACKLENPDSESIPDIIQLNRLESGHYNFPEGTEDGNYVVFSDTFDVQRVVPKLYDYREGTIIDNLADVRTVNSEKSKEAWFAALEDGFVQNSTAWSKVPVYMEIADKYRIPFRSFNALTMAVSTPKLATRLLMCLFWNNKTDSVLPALLKMEQEFAMAFHWNRSSIINKEMSDLISAVSAFAPTLVTSTIHNFMSFFVSVMSMTLDEDVAAGLARAFSGNLRNVDADVIQNADMSMYRSRAIGKNPGNSDLPIIDLPLKKSYYSRMSASDLNEYQRTLIHSPLFVYEYTQGWNDALWDDSDEGLTRRRVIIFYRQYYKYSYYKILFDMLK